MEHDRLRVNYEGKPSYDIVMANSFDSLKKEIQALPPHYGKACIVTDSRVGDLYLSQLQAELANQFSALISFTFPEGEANKNLQTIEELYECLIQSHFDRHDLLIALGGGVVGDMTGFAAATYMRGIDFVQVPTSLLAQVDSSVGGKTGIDFSSYKNMVGAFKMPSLVYMNIASLKTLDPMQFDCGMGEVIKHGLIRDLAYYQWIKSHHDRILDMDLDTLAHMVYWSVDIKRRTCEIDPKEESIRAHLNFGHTIGHAIEKLSAFRLFHGQCVSIGSIAALYLSHKLGKISNEEIKDAIACFQSFHLPVSIHSKDYPQMGVEEILSASKSDKKMQESRIKFVILERMGEASTYLDFTDEDLREAISFIIE